MESIAHLSSDVDVELRVDLHNQPIDEALQYIAKTTEWILQYFCHICTHLHLCVEQRVYSHVMSVCVCVCPPEDHGGYSDLVPSMPAR